MNGNIHASRVCVSLNALRICCVEDPSVCHYRLDLITCPDRIICAYVSDDLTGTKHDESGGDGYSYKSDCSQHPLSVFPGLVFVVEAKGSTEDDEGCKHVVCRLRVEFAAPRTSSNNTTTDRSESDEEESEIAINSMENDSSSPNTGNELKDGKNPTRYGAINVEEKAWFVHFLPVPKPLAWNSQGSDILWVEHHGTSQTKTDESTAKDDQQSKTVLFFEAKDPGDVPVGVGTEFPAWNRVY